VTEHSPGADGTVRPATRADVPELAAVLSHAIANKPHFIWVQGSSKLCAIFTVEASPPATAAFRVGLRETGEAQAKA
jgi:hypothetical protein